ncbi:MAG: prephenate dehydrogenase/arogenate dehydrogenase family protein [Nitrosomonas sp.]|nr:prephenate dehydrogenase/arogenate dehydrogenase family protein [Nitrosomonas sp.]MDP1949648.1 prephenate dehydrogenase/arogenate dehydrogenase family protein [Nitrosomonas sp.]
MAHTILNKLVIIGVGLIGGSFALALRKAGIVQHIVGVGRSQENMQRALNLGVIDEMAIDPASALHNADAVLLAMPVGQTRHIMAQIAPHLEAGTLLTDVGSTKQDVITAARTCLTDNLKNFVPGHPIAGAELSGVEAAQADLFRGKPLILTPLAETNPHALEQVTAWWQSCGAQVSQMNADEHDKILAATSHLPHILAFTLMNHLRNSSTNHPDDLLRFAGSGFRDFTRIAGSSPEMWRDICLANREALLTQIDAYQNELKLLQELLKNNEGDALEQAFSQARGMRENWLKNKD